MHGPHHVAQNLTTSMTLSAESGPLNLLTAIGELILQIGDISKMHTD